MSEPRQVLGKSQVSEDVFRVWFFGFRVSAQPHRNTKNDTPNPQLQLSPLAFQPVHIFHRAEPEFERHGQPPPDLVLDFAEKRQLRRRPAGQHDAGLYGRCGPVFWRKKPQRRVCQFEQEPPADGCPHGRAAKTLRPQAVGAQAKREGDEGIFSHRADRCVRFENPLGYFRHSFSIV